MPERYSGIVVLCEDLQQRVFVYRFLCRKGIQQHSIRINQCPKGKGSGEQYVRERFHVEVRGIRSRPHLSVALIVVSDADVQPTQTRLFQLAQALKDHGQKPPAANEAIAILTPKRNIETWIHYLLGTAVNEDQEYAKFPEEQRKCEPAVQALVRDCPTAMKIDAPPSLLVACNELTRLLQHPD